MPLSSLRLPPLEVPGQLTRDGAARAARQELGRAVYHQHDPSPLRRALGFVGHQIGVLLRHLHLRTPSGGRPPTLDLVPLLVLLVALALLVLLVVVGLRSRRRRGEHDPLGGATQLAADELRAEADDLAARGRWREAVRARVRAVVRELEDRGVLDRRPGRTAGEIAGEAGVAVPAIGADVREVARIFDEVWYGDKPADRARYDRVSELDARVAGARLRVGDGSELAGAAAAGPALPR